MSSPTLLQIVPTLAGGGLARATLDAAHSVIAAGGSAIVASPGGALVPDLRRLRATHLELPEHRHPLWGRLTLPRKLAASLADASVSLIQAVAGERGGSAPSGSPHCMRPSCRLAWRVAWSSAAKCVPIR